MKKEEMAITIVETNIVEIDSNLFLLIFFFAVSNILFFPILFLIFI